MKMGLIGYAECFVNEEPMQPNVKLTGLRSFSR